MNTATDIMGEFKHQLTIFYFFSLGLWGAFTSVIVMQVALEDILAGTLWSSTVVLLTFSIPDVITRALISHYLLNRISFRSAFGLLTLLLVGSYILLVIIDDVRIRLVGVGILGIGYGFGMITFVRMLSYYGKADVLASAFYNGTNISSLAVSFFYTGLTTWACLSPRIALAICIPFCFLPLVFYLLLDKGPLKDHLKKTTDRQSVQYTALNDQDHSTDDDESATQTPELISKLMFALKVFPSLAYIFWAIFCFHFIMAAVLTTLTFESSPFQPRDHYQYYRFINNIGFSFGGSVHLLFSCLESTKWIEFFTIRKIWVLTLSDIFHLVFFVFASWYRFLPNVTIVLVMCLTQGITHGLTTVNSAVNLANKFSSVRDRGTALSIMQLGYCLGRIAAALQGISTEKLLQEHCTNTLMLGRFCLARNLGSNTF